MRFRKRGQRPAVSAAEARLSRLKPTCFDVLLKAALLHVLHSVGRQILVVLEQPTSSWGFKLHEAAGQAV